MEEKTKFPKPPKTHQEFVSQYPKLGEAWDLIGEAEKEGPFDDKTRRLLKLAVAIGAKQVGTVHSSVRKALAVGASQEEIEGVIALGASTIGMPSTVAVFSWAREVLEGKK